MAAFFPGLLANGVLLSGNVAYVLYGAVFLAALLGWRRGQWWPFYAAVIAASCVKAPFLSFALLPALSARRQWRQAATAVVVGLAFFALQPVIWPSLFRHYLQAVELQFSFNHDFGCAPVGLFSQLLDAHGISYAPWCYLFYAAYAAPLFAALVYFSRRFLRGDFVLAQWAPVLLLGILLLNPRVMEYDVAPMTLPLALVAWRYARERRQPRRWTMSMLVLFVLLNAGALYSWQLRKALDGPLVVAILLSGFWSLLQQVRSSGAKVETGATLRSSGNLTSAHRDAEHALAFAPAPLTRSA